MTVPEWPGAPYIGLHSAEPTGHLASISFDPEASGINDFVITRPDGTLLGRVHDTNRGFWLSPADGSPPRHARTWAEVAEAAGFPDATLSTPGGGPAPHSAHADALQARWEAENSLDPGPTEDMLTTWNEHNAHADGLGYEPGELDFEAGC